MKRKIIFDCDVGTDDAVALTAALLAKNLDIIGITTVHGNQPVENTTDNALRLTQFLGKDIPVYAGCAHAMTRHLLGVNHAVRMQQVQKLDENGEEIRIHEAHIKALPPTTRQPQKAHACTFLVDTLRQASEKITIVAVGPLTNLGIALRMAPEIAKNIDEIYIMGGSIAVGNRTPVAEANFYDDPEAAQIVLASGIKNIICPLETSITGPLTCAVLDKLVTANAKVGGFLKELTQGFITRMRLLGTYDSHTEAGMCDWGAVAPLINPDIITDIRREAVEVEVTRGFADGMMIIDRRGFVNIQEETTQNFVLYGLDGQKMYDTLESLLKNA